MLCQTNDNGRNMVLLTGKLSFAATLIVSFEYGPRMSDVTCSLVKTRRASDVTKIGLHPAFLMMRVRDSRLVAK